MPMPIYEQIRPFTQILLGNCVEFLYEIHTYSPLFLFKVFRVLNLTETLLFIYNN